MSGVRKGFVVLLMALVGGCASNKGSSLPAAAYFFTKPEPVLIREVWRSPTCASWSKQGSVVLHPNRAELQAWATEQSVDLSVAGGGQIPDAAVAVILLGQRPGKGWGFAISNEATYRAGTLEVSATFFEPPPEEAAQGKTDYCSIIELPHNYEIKGVRVSDQFDALRIWSE